MSDLKKRSTTINEFCRRKLDITRDEYALCSYIHYRCADSRQKHSGWCGDNKDEIAEFVGITRRGLYKMQAKMEAAELLEIAGGGALRATKKWIDAENEREQSSQNDKAASENKVHTECEQSSQQVRTKFTPNVNKVPEVYIEVNKVNISNKEEEYATANAALAPPFQKIDEYEIPEAEKNTPSITPGRGAIRVTITDPNMPDVKIVDEIPPGPKIRPPKGGRTSNARRDISPQIHPENETAFQYFSDPQRARDAWQHWIEYKTGEHRFRYKTADSEITKLRQLFKETGGDSENMERAINHSIGNGYKGIFKPKEEKEHGQSKFNSLNPAQKQHLNLAVYIAERRKRTANGDARKVDWITGEKPV